MIKARKAEAAAAILIFLAPVGFLSVGHWVNACTYSLFIISLVWILRCRPYLDAFDLGTLFVLSSPIAAVAIGQLLRQQLLLSDFDAPARLLASFFIYLMLGRLIKEKRLSTEKIGLALISGLASGLVIVSLTIDPAKTQFFGGRYSTSLTETNTLGAYLALFTGAIGVFLLGVLSHDRKSTIRSLSLLASLLLTALGFYLVTKTQSRGAFIGLVTGFFVLMASGLWLKDYRRAAGISIGLLSVLLCLAWLSGLLESTTGRWASIMSEPISWWKTDNQASSGGIRLSMMVASFDLFRAQWLTGYGDMGYSEALTKSLAGKYSASTIHDMSLAGPHQEILARSLQSGIWGFVSSVTLFLAPIGASLWALMKHKPSNANNIDKIFLLGCLTYSFQMLALQFTTEPYSLKATASFNGLVLAILFAIAGNSLRSGEQNRV